MREDVVALYVDRRGPYPRLLRRWYDEERDARTYEGTLPVVAHPPCGPWGLLRHRCKRPQDRELAPHAVDVVRRVGGVLEHPRGSLLWDELGLPRPGHLPDVYGGQTFRVNQVEWGHACVKPTWLYVVGVPEVRRIPMKERKATHQIWGSHGSRMYGHRTDLRAANATMRRRTPLEFALWLIGIASPCEVRCSLP